MNNLGLNAIGDEGIIFLHQFPALQVLHLSWNKITEKGIEIMSKGEFPHLQEIDLSNKVDILGWNVIGDELHHLHKFQSLQVLDLRATKLTGKGIKILSEGEFPNLRSLDLGNKIVIIGSNHEIDVEALKFLGRLSALEKLSLRFNKITAKGV